MPTGLGLAMTLAAVALVGTAPATRAAVNAYLFIDGVKGDATDARHEKWIELDSMQWGVERAGGSPPGGQAARESSAPSVSEIVVSKSADKASPLLAKCAASGCRYPTATLEVSRPGGAGPVRYLLTDVRIAVVHTSSGGDRPTESVSLNFTKIEMKARPTAEAAGKSASVMAPATAAAAH